MRGSPRWIPGCIRALHHAIIRRQARPGPGAGTEGEELLMKRARASHAAPYLLVSLAMVAPEAWAYLDPSTGSMILSAIIGVFATAALALKTFWYKIKGLFRRDAVAPPAQQAAEHAAKAKGSEPVEPPAARE